MLEIIITVVGYYVLITAALLGVFSLLVIALDAQGKTTEPAGTIIRESFVFVMKWPIWSLKGILFILLAFMGFVPDVRA